MVVVVSPQVGPPTEPEPIPPPTRAQFAALEALYPSSDGKPVAENTEHLDLLLKLKANFDWLYVRAIAVFVAADLLWYPTEGSRACKAPDVMVIFGRPKGYRGSYLQWLEAGIAPHFVVEIISPTNTRREMGRKWQFYNQHGVEEYLTYNTIRHALQVWQRPSPHASLQLVLDVVGRKSGRNLRSNGRSNGRGNAPSNAGRELAVPTPVLWTSPRTGVGWGLGAQSLEAWRPDGRAFLSLAELEQERLAAIDRAVLAERQAVVYQRETAVAYQQAQAAQEQAQAAQEQAQAAQEQAQAAQEQAQAAQEQAQAAQARADRLAELLRQQGIDPDAL